MMKSKSNDTKPASRSVASAVAKTNSTIQRVKGISTDYATRENNRSGKATMTVALDGNLDEGAAAVAQDSLTLSRGMMEHIVPESDQPLTAMHLLNEKLGGTGAEVDNLAWGSKKHNEKHFNGIEREAQDFAKDKKYTGHTMEYTTLPEYFLNDTKDTDKAGFYFLKSVTSKYTIFNTKGEDVGSGSKVIEADGKMEELDEDYSLEESSDEKKEPIIARDIEMRPRKTVKYDVDEVSSEDERFDNERKEIKKQKKEEKRKSKLPRGIVKKSKTRKNKTKNKSKIPYYG